MNTRFLVTGGQGFIGRYLIALLLSFKTSEVLSIGRSMSLQDSFTHSINIGGKSILAPLSDDLRPDRHGERYRYASIDLCKSGQGMGVIQEFRPDVVIHLASGLQGDPLEDLFCTNVVGTKNLIEALAAFKMTVNKFIFVSSGGVYGASKIVPTPENTECFPVDIYSASKLSAEHVCRISCQRHRIPCLIARVFNIVGPGQDERHVCGRFASQIASMALSVTSPILEVGDLSPTRDFIDVRDVSTALYLLVQRGGVGEIYNIGTGVETQIARVLSLALELSGLVKVVKVKKEARESGLPRNVAEVSRIEGLGFHAAYSLRQSIKDLLQYYSEAMRHP